MSESGSLFLKYWWEWVVFVKKWVGVGSCCFEKMGGSGSLFLTIGGSGLFLLKNGWEWVAFVTKWVGVGESGWEWVRVAGSAIQSRPIHFNMISYYKRVFKKYY